jgi:hypothetical protein
MEFSLEGAHSRGHEDWLHSRKAKGLRACLACTRTGGCVGLKCGVGLDRHGWTCGRSFASTQAPMRWLTGGWMRWKVPVDPRCGAPVQEDGDRQMGGSSALGARWMDGWI